MGLLDKCEKVKKEQKNLGNKGMSFVEIIIVVAIIAIVAVGSVSIVGLISSGDAKKAAKTVGTQLNDIKNKTLSIYGSWEGQIGVNENDVYEICTVKNGEVLETSTLGSRVDVAFYAGGDTSGSDVSDYVKEYKLDAANRLTIVYSQSTGAIEKVKVGEENVLDTDSTSGVIRVSSGNTIFLLKLYYKTGKIIAEY